MSSYDVQRATALLIRRPDSFRGQEFESFLTRFNLTEHEKFQVKSLSENRTVRKFGVIMGSSRERKVTTLLPLSKAYLSNELVAEIWKMHFEPTAIETHFNQLPTAFLNFLIENEGAGQLLKEKAPPFVKDMLLFEAAQAQFRMKHFSTKREVPEGSRLMHPNFILLKLNYDIQGLRAQIIKEKKEAGTVVPAERKVNLLFVRQGTEWNARIFEIDEEVYAFLEGELKSPPEGRPLPASYATLVKLGIAKEVSPC